MGIIGRLLVPRSVRRAAHPVRTARQAVTPRPIKQVRRAAFKVTNPWEAAEGAVEDMVVGALRPKPRRRRGGTGGAIGYGSARGYAEPGYLTKRELAEVERERKRDERERTYQRAMENEKALVEVHHKPIAEARQRAVPAPVSVDRAALESKVADELGLNKLESELGHPSQRPFAPESEPVDEGELKKHAQSRLLSEIAWYRRNERKRLRVQAAAEAATLARELTAERANTRAEEQKRLDSLWSQLLRRRQESRDEVERRVTAEDDRRRLVHEQEQQRAEAEWRALLRNDEKVARPAIDSALREAGSRARVAHWNQGSPITLLEVPPVDVVPERTPSTTPAGNRTFRKRTKTEINDFYFEILASRIIATVRATFGSAPGVKETSVLAVRGTGSDRAAFYFGAFERDAFNSAVQPGRIEPVTFIGESSRSRINLRGRTRELAAIDLPDEPVLQEVAATEELSNKKMKGTAAGSVLDDVRNSAVSQGGTWPAPGRIKFSDDPDEQARREAGYALTTLPARSGADVCA